MLRHFIYFLQELLRVVFEFDGRAYKTAFRLMTRPGFLTREYFEGRRVSYTPPLRLFLIISIGFFLIVSIVSTLRSLQDTLVEVVATQEAPGEAEDPAEEFNDISEFDKNYEIIRNIRSKKIDISNKEWILKDTEIYVQNNKKIVNELRFNTNFDYEIIQNLFSNMSSLSFL